MDAMCFNDGFGHKHLLIILEDHPLQNRPPELSFHRKHDPIHQLLPIPNIRISIAESGPIQ